MFPRILIIDDDVLSCLAIARPLTRLGYVVMEASLATGIPALVQEGTLGKLVKDESLYTEARQTLTEARGTLGNLRSVSQRIADGKGTLGKLLTDDSMYTDMKGAVASLNTIMKKVERGEGTLGKLINDDSLYFTTKDNLKKVGKAADQLREQGPLSIIGIGIQALGAF